MSTVELENNAKYHQASNTVENKEHKEDDSHDKKINIDHESFKNIGAYIWIDKIDDVDVVNQTFTAELHVNFAWQGTEKDFNEYNDKGKSYKPTYNPYDDFSFRNASTIHEQEIVGYGVITKGAPNYYGIICTKTSYPYLIYVTYRITADFSEQFELENFPFDCQDLQIELQLKKSSETICCYPGFYNYKEEETGFMQGGIALNNSNFTEYDCMGIIVESYLDVFGSGMKYGTINYRIKLSRKWQIYFWKIIIFIFIITMCTFLVYSMPNDIDYVADKYSLLLTLLLTDVAFQFVISSFIPNLPYLTTLDIYAICSFVIIFIVVIQTFIYSVLDITDDAINVINIISLFIFFVLQIIFVVYVYKSRMYERKKLTMDIFDYKNEEYETDQEQNTFYIKHDHVSVDKGIADFMELQNEDIPRIKAYKKP